MSNTRRIKRPNVHDQRVAVAQAYFAQHPTAEAFTRPATPAERLVFGLAPGTMVRVVKTRIGFAHAYAPPPVGRN
jgi:hypothetical protein